jgi:GNAT superfamily N-acetyltransferase
MSQHFIIRPAALTDTRRLTELSGSLGYPNDEAVIASRLATLLGRTEDAVLVAESADGTVIGWIHGAEHLLLEADRRCEILGLVVDPSHRGLGVGRGLVAHLEQWARGRGVEMISVRSNVIRLESHPFYERLGFTRAKTQHAYRKSLTR